MKFKVGDTVLITAGKDKGKKGEIVRVLSDKNQVVVKDINMYTRHVKPFAGRPGEKVRKERPLDGGKIAIVNDKGQVDRIGYVVAKDGSKKRVFRKTGTVIDTKAKKTTKKK